MINLDDIKGKIVCIYGPTASGKSRIASYLASKTDAFIINADSMQIYKDVPIITSQPSYEELSAHPHKLYAEIDLIAPFSVNDWLKITVKEIRHSLQHGKTPIVVGGTGFYFYHLINGLCHVPEITEQTKLKICDIAKQSNEDIHHILHKHDPNLAKKLHPNDRHRVLRGLEVVLETGKSLLELQKDNKVFFNKELFFSIYINLPRDNLYEDINARFLEMIEQGVVKEVRDVLAKYKDQKLPKIIGLKTIGDYINKSIEFNHMVTEVQKTTRNYAKRQCTWFNNQLTHNIILNTLAGVVI